MPKYRVTIPVYTRLVEIHYITADDEDEARDEARCNDPDETEEDYDYYEMAKDGIEVERVSTDVEDLAETHDSREE
jgi:hypothetical protein